MGIFISPGKTIECVIIALCLGLLLTMATSKFLGILQESGYSMKKAAKWLRKKNNMYFERLSLLSLLCFLSAGVVGLCFSFAGSWAAIISLIPVAILFTVFICADRKIALRIDSVKTKRYRRLQVVLYLVCAIISYIVVTLLNFADYCWGNAMFTAVKYCILAPLPMLLPCLAALANCIDKIYEVPHNKSYIKKAKGKIADSSVKVVGITGSYGKTTVKNILAAMLSKKYRVLTTPRSHNTPLGISMAINDANLADYDVFIAEMGARNVGDIAELCTICVPEYAVITGISSQHLETFESLENIVKAKGEILNGPVKAYIAADCADYYSGYPVAKGDVNVVSDIVADSTGTQFSLTLGGETVRVKTVLLGEHSAYNIGLAAALAYDMGVSIGDIADAIESLDFIPHRLQLTNSNGVNILDDGYNANVNGARAALKVLRYFDGRKIAVTPGMVELGILEQSENKQLGTQLAGLDLVILVGDTLITPVKEGYLEAGGDPDKLIVKGTLSEAQDELKWLSEGDTVLFLNDLPDVY